MKLLQSHVSADNVFKTVSINIGISRYAEMNRDLLESYISHQVAGNEWQVVGQERDWVWEGKGEGAHS